MFKYQSNNVLVQTINNCVDCRDSYDCDIYTRDITVDCRHKIPDRCPKLLKQLDYVATCLRHHPEVQKRLRIVAEEPYLYDHGLAHADVVTTIGNQFLDAYKGASFRKDLCLVRIAALLHELGRVEAEGHDPTFASAQVAECLLSQVSGLSLTDKLTIIDAILYQNELLHVVASESPVVAALYFGDKLSFGRACMKSKVLKNILELSDFDKQAYSVMRVSFRVRRPEMTGVLTITYDRHEAFAMGFGEEFTAEAFTECPELIVGPYEVAKKYLGLKDFRIRVRSASLLYPGEQEEYIFSVEDFKFL